MDLSKILGRFFNRSQSPIAGDLLARITTRPLLVHPREAQTMAAAFARGMGLDGGGEYDENGERKVAASAGTIAVLNISGPMTSRPEPGLCGTPLSYEAIRCAFDAALGDSNVSAIVFRFASGGGEAAGVFDLTDYIFSKRGTKPIRAQIDDRAYSAAYAIASACDSIQVSRTSGVGSVGVVACHIDQSGSDKQDGLSFEYIFSGAHKVDGNPHGPLPESVRNKWQADCDSIRSLFVESVAKYRGLDAAFVQDTEAQDYLGDAGVKAKLADSIGTLGDLLAELAAPAIAAPPESQTTEDDEDDAAMPEATAPVAGAVTETPEQIATRTAAAAKAAETNDKNARDAALTVAVMASSLAPAVKLAVIAKGPAVNVDAAAQVAEASHIADLCAAAKMPEYAADFVKAGKSVEHVRKELSDPPKGADGKVIRQREITNHLPERGATSSNNVDTASVFGPAVKQMQADRQGPGFKSARPTY